MESRIPSKNLQSLTNPLTESNDGTDGWGLWVFVTIQSLRKIVIRMPITTSAQRLDLDVLPAASPNLQSVALRGIRILGLR